MTSAHGADKAKLVRQMRRILAKTITFEAGLVYLTDLPSLQPKTELEKALDAYMLALPADYFEDQDDNPPT